MDATKKPLFIPPEFANYAEQHGLFQMYEKILQKLIIAQPDDPISYMIDILKEDNDEAPRIIVHGPPASGKRTMSKMIQQKLRCVHITLDSLLAQSELECDSPALKKAKELSGAKMEVPVDVWIALIKDRIQQIDCVKKGWLLEGFPRTRDEALQLQMSGIAPEHFVLLDAPDTVLIERVMGKRIDPETGDVYHVTFDWPTDPAIVDRLVTDPNSTEEAMIKRLMEYHRHSHGILRCYEKVYKVINCDQPKADVFSQVMTYLVVMKRSPAPHTPRVILLGPTGSGKAVQAALIASKYNLIDVSCDELIEQSLVNDSKTGQAIKPYLDRKMQVPDDLIVELLKGRLGQMDAITQGWVIHGFPKNREQAESLNRIGFETNRVIYMDVPTDTLLERLTLCSTDPLTGERYHALYGNPPMNNEVKERLKMDPKDSEDQIKERVLSYQDHIEDIADYYQDLGQHVNADQDPHTVFECIESIIVNPIPKKG